MELGIYSKSAAVTISGDGSLTVNGTMYGVYAHDGDGIINIDSGITSVVASGSYGAFFGRVKNFVAGNGWTNKDGTEGKAPIAINTTGASLEYKKCSFRLPAQKAIRG